jgi:hypothetical protein
MGVCIGKRSGRDGHGETGESVGEKLWLPTRKGEIAFVSFAHCILDHPIDTN